jgi:hypothetical protein
MVLRYLILHVDPKLVDIMLELARDQHAMALQSVTETSGEGNGEGGGEGEEGRRPRRGPRPVEAEEGK